MDLGYAKCGLSIILQKVKLKVVELTQTRPAPFWSGVPKNSQWYQFKTRHPNFIIKQVKGLNAFRAQGLTINNYKTFCDNL